MSRKLPDLFAGCYEGDHRKLSPEEFREDWCGKCANAGCRNSQSAGLGWVQRMLTQEDYLLNDPKFAEGSDPRYKHIREQDFPDMVREALLIQVSSQKGDWSIPTEEDIGRAAAEMVGMVPPAGFQSEPAPKAEEPEPPERLVDEVQEYDLGETEPTPLPRLRGETRVIAHLDDAQDLPSPVDEDGRRYLSDPKAHEVVLDPDMDEVVYAAIDEPDPEPEPEPSDDPIPDGQWRVRGDSGTIYDVFHYEDGGWSCSCPSRENPCKHALSIAVRLERAPPEGKPVGNPTRPPESAPASYRGTSSNTSASRAGQMIGGEPAPKTEPKADPWAPPPEAKPKERVISVGGKVRFGSGKKG